ncbi:Subtilase family protein [Amycolatopsis xylanica]|uniref:Subtilase family protein n=2 Tax=Amycolatopsis xylanica TaxID=589385 RepID=A0A1H2W225_9PSEU|nr:Subtilase family protein [Amycolatopsis xylanica]
MNDPGNDPGAEYAGKGRVALPVSQYQDVLAALPEGTKLDRIPECEDLPAEVIWQKDHILLRGDISLEDAELKARGAVLAKVDGKVQKVRPGLARLVKINGNAREAVEALSGRFDGGIWLNHLMTICGVNMCPADEPIPVPNNHLPLPRWDKGGEGGKGVFVRVIDTGLAYGWREGHDWVADEIQVTGDELDQGNTYRPAGPTAGDIKLDVGHGAFIAGILRCIAPKVKVHVDNLFKWAGTMFEFQVRDAILAALEATPAPNIISLSAGCTTLTGKPPRAMQEVIDVMKPLAHKPLLVAAAGNDGLGEGDQSLFYPAAFAQDHGDFVVAVGALRQDRKGRACFSNFGDYVSVYDDGERRVNAFPKGWYTYHEPITYNAGSHLAKCYYYQPDPIYLGCTCVTGIDQGIRVQFDGMARWSGTSFSTPIVAAKVAKQMSSTGDPDARHAWETLYSHHQVVVDQAGGYKLKVLP